MVVSWLKQHWGECLFGGVVVATLLQVFAWVWPSQTTLTSVENALLDDPQTDIQQQQTNTHRPKPYVMVSTAAVKKMDTQGSGYSMMQLMEPEQTATIQTVSINQATAGQLEALPGVGPKLAERIIAYRQSHGRIESWQDLDQVKGIGPALAARLEPYVRF